MEMYVSDDLFNIFGPKAWTGERKQMCGGSLCTMEYYIFGGVVSVASSTSCHLSDEALHVVSWGGDSSKLWESWREEQNPLYIESA